MRVTTGELREATLKLLEHLDSTGQSSFEIDEDYYWAIPSESRYEPSVAPRDLTVGQLVDDWRELREITSGRREPIGYALVWLSSLLRRVGEKSVG